MFFPPPALAGGDGFAASGLGGAAPGEILRRHLWLPISMVQAG
jgi:hypothetical protein